MSTTITNNIETEVKTETKASTNIETEVKTETKANTNTFAMFNLPESLSHTLAHMKYEVPTPVQCKTIPRILEGKDILASAQTGTGKTGAFAIPLVAKILESSNDSVLVLTPTRELASQVMDIFHQLLGKRSKISTALLIGGDAIVKQFRQLNQNPRVIVGTPGRVNDHIMRRTLKLHDTKYLVLDETDRMLDMGFDIQIEEIIRHLPTERQTLMFSATIANRIAALSKKYLNNPERIDCGVTNTAAPKIKQENIHTSEKAKYEILTQELGKREGSVIVFVKTKRDADELASRLRHHDHRADAIHGDLQQRRRERVISDFRQKRYRIMVATDVASRGLDIPHIEHVINFNLPHCPEDYIHRIGRTARAGAEGSALNLISPEDDKKWKAINRLLNPGSAKHDHEERSSRGGSRRGGYGGNRPYQQYGSSRGGQGNGRGQGGGYRGQGGQGGQGGYGRRNQEDNRGGFGGGEGHQFGRYASNTSSSSSNSNASRGDTKISYVGDKRKKYGSSNGVSNQSRKSAPFFPQRKDQGSFGGRREKQGA